MNRNTQFKPYNFAVYIGRFQGFHNGQYANIINGLEIAEKLIIVIGSDNKPIDWKNPWTANERITMIKDSLTKEQLSRIHFQTISDKLYQDQEWAASVYEAVDAILLQYSKYRLNSFREEQRPKIALAGCDKDDSTWYLGLFPDWKQEFTEPFCHEDNKNSPLNATHIRNLLYSHIFEKTQVSPLNYKNSIKSLVPEGSFNFMLKWADSESAQYVYDWYKMDMEYQKPYEVLPYGTNFYCADNIVVHSGHVLLVKRKFHPGKNLWALPGGHINKNENALEASIRELYEETNIKVPEKIMKANLIEQKLFDHPDRSLRGRCGKIVGRTISIAHCYHLTGGEGLPRVSGNDDAAEAWWFNLGQIKNMRNEMFEDHFDIINYFLAKI